MDNYLLFGHLLKCHVVEPSKLHPETFKGANKRFTKLPWDKMEREKHNKARTPEEREKQVQRLLAKEEEKREKIKEALGVDFEFGGYAAEAAQLTSGDEESKKKQPKKKAIKA